MKIKNLHLKNFRCFEDFEIEFNTGDENHGGLTLLVAKNGEGKTTVLDAINIIIAPFLAKLTGEKDKYGIELSDNRRTQEGLEYATMEALFTNPLNFQKIHNYPTFSVVRYFDGLKKSTKTEDHYHLNSLAKYIFNWQNGGTPWPLLVYYDDQRFLDHTKKKSQLFSILSQERLAGYQDARKPAVGYKQSLQWMNELSMALYRELKKKDDGDLSYNPDTLESLQHFMECLEHALLETMKPSGYTNINFNVMRNEIEAWGNDHPVRVEVSRLSAGSRMILVMVSDMVCRCCLLNPALKDKILLDTPGIVLIDEIELHLHPSWQQQILPTLQKIFPKIQFIVTTHSPQVVSSVPKECVRIIDDGKVVPFSTQTQGVESQDILAEIFGTDPAYQEDAYVKKLNQYAQLAASGKTNEKLYQELVEHYGSNYQPLLQIEIHRKFVLRKKQETENAKV